MSLRDYHMHTTYCDGNNTAEEMVLAGISLGLEEIGISGHSHTSFDESYCMSHEETDQYRRELLSLREKYADRISIRIGLEMDRYSDADTSEFDYTIGSSHYIRISEPEGVQPSEGCLRQVEDGRAFVYIPVDETAEILREAADAYFGSDLIALAEAYYEGVGTVAEATGCRIIGHFDLITKFNEPWLKDPSADRKALIDTSDSRYIRAWKRAVDQLLPYDVPFEINTGAMSKGYRSSPYPAEEIRDYIREKGGRFILSSDSHRTDTLCYKFDEFEHENHYR